MDKYKTGGEYFLAIDKAWQFFMKNENPKTDEDWDVIVSELEQFKTPLEIDLMLAVVNELERTYKELGACLLG